MEIREDDDGNYVLFYKDEQVSVAYVTIAYAQLQFHDVCIQLLKSKVRNTPSSVRAYLNNYKD